MLDIKGWDKEEHFKMVKFENTNPIKNLKYLKIRVKEKNINKLISPTDEYLEKLQSITKKFKVQTIIT